MTLHKINQDFAERTNFKMSIIEDRFQIASMEFTKTTPTELKTPIYHLKIEFDPG